MKNILSIMIIALLAITGCTNTKSNNASVVNNADSIRKEEVVPVEIPWDSIPADSSEVETYVSEDGNVRTCSWNTHMEGYFPYASICVIRNKKGEIKIVDVYDVEADWYLPLDVHSIVRKDGLTYYIFRIFSKTSASCGYMGMAGYMIDGDSLKRVGVIKCEDLKKDIEMTEYSISDLYFLTYGHGFDWIWDYDEKTRTLYVPIFNEYGLTDLYYVYEFDGMEFKRVKGIQPHKGLHESLCDYKCLELYCETKNYIIRIDRCYDGALRYASWKKPLSMSDKPDIVIPGIDVVKLDYDTNEYIFENEGIEYVVQYPEYKKVSGVIRETRYYLLVRKGNKILLKEKIE